MRALSLQLLLCVAGFASLVGAARADLLDSAISVQGVLSVNGEAADGVYDLRLTPYSALLQGVTLGPPQVLENIPVVQGAFTAKVDFGSSLFLGDKVYLEIEVRPGNETGGFELLVPRQQLTAAPYALKPAAGSVTDLELAIDAVGAAQIADGEVRSAELGDAAVTALKLADGAVATAKLADAAVTAPKLADAAVGAAQIADGAVRTPALADGAATAAKVAVDAIDSGKVLDGSLTAADLAPGVVGAGAWRVDGNAPTPGQFLGTTNATPLELRSEVGVTLNGARFNNNTELTIRGNPATPETNADLTLWPRGGSAFFNLAAVGNDPGQATLQWSAVGTSPYTGYVTRMVLGHAGALGVGSADPTPQATLHAIRTDLGVDAADLADAYELIAEDADAQIALLSNNSAPTGSAILFGEMNGGSFANAWGVWRSVGGINPTLSFGYGGNSAAAGNTPRLVSYADGSLFAGSVPPSANPVRSFAFVDGSSGNAFEPSAADQFLVRAAGGVGINRTPASGSTELSLGPDAPGATTDLVVGEAGTLDSNVSLTLGSSATDSSYRLYNGLSPSGNTTLTIGNRNSASAESPMFQLFTDGSGFSRRLGLFRGTTTGSYLLPNFPIHVGDSSIANSGNGAHLTTGGVWTNGSSRGFKEGFATVDSGEILARVLSLPVLAWRYKGADPERHLGPMAEDFAAAFGLGGDPRYIGTVDADGVALAAIQGLNAKLEAENSALREVLATLAARLEALERARSAGGPADAR